MFWIFLIITIATLTACSMLHGAGKVRKGILVPISMAALCCVSYMAGDSLYTAAIGILMGAVYWLTFRRGPQADAEMLAMALPESKRLVKACLLYLPGIALCWIMCVAATLVTHDKIYTYLAFIPLLLVWVPALACSVFNTVGYVWPDTPENKKVQSEQRRMVELFVTIAPAGIAVASALLAACATIKHITLT